MLMAKLRIGVLYDFWWDEDETRGDDDAARPKRKSPDEDVQEVYEALKKAGHNPFFLRLDGTPQSLLELAQSETDLFFNLVESFGGDDTARHQRRRLPRAAGSPFHRRGLARSLPRAGQGARQEDLRLPWHPHAVLHDRLPRPPEHSHDIQFPVIVKPAREDGSIGIHFGAVCSSIRS